MKLRVLLILCFWLLLETASAVAAQAATAAAAQASQTGQDAGWVRLGVIAASQKGMGGDRPLRFAYRDGERIEKMLASVGQIDSANLFLIKVEGKADFRQALLRIGDRILDLKRRNLKVFLQFYYSGHGGARNFHLSDGEMSFDEVKEALGGTMADARLYVLDVCFGASFFTAKGFRTAPPVQLQMEMDQAAKGEVTISSSSVDEQAYEVRSLGGSIFTSQWIMALRGAGDRNRDGQVTLFEAYNYAYDRTSGYSAETLDRPQHPSYQMDLTGARDVMLARLVHSSTGIFFKGCPAGLYNLVDLQRGIQIGELRIPEGEDFTLALEPGKYRVQYKSPQGRSVAANLDLSPTAMTPLPFEAFLPQSPGSGVAKGSAGPEAERAADQTGGISDEADNALETSPVAGSGSGGAAPSDRPRTRSPTLLDRTGYTLWFALEPYSDAKFRESLNQFPESDRSFGLGGRFEIPAVQSAWGIELSWPASEHWFYKAHIGFSAMDYTLRSEGREPLHSPTDSLGGKYPVRLAWDYQITDFQWGAGIGRNFQVTPGHSFSLDGSVTSISRSVKSIHSVERTLFAATTRDEVSSTATGFRIEAGATWLQTLAVRPGGHPWVAGLRLAPYLSEVDHDEENPGRLNLDSQEYGLAVSLCLSLGSVRPPERNSR